MKKLITGLSLAGILVIIFGTLYATLQQTQRESANYPQIQIAEDTAAALDKGDPPPATAGGNVDIAASLAPFTIIYDKKGQVFMSSGSLNKQAPKAPLSMLAASASKGKTYNAVTWQPQKGVRIAAVIVSAKNYYVLSGRSLTEVEKNETHTMQLALVGGVLSLLVLGAAIVARSLASGY